MSLLRKAVMLTIFILITGCTQWGTSVFRTVDVWWACPNANERCSPESAALTYLQMRNTYNATLGDLQSAVASKKFSPQELAPTRLALENARSAYSRISDPPFWGDALTDFTLWTVKAEQRVSKLYGKLYK